MLHKNLPKSITNILINDMEIENILIKFANCIKRLLLKAL